MRPMLNRITSVTVLLVCLILPEGLEAKRKGKRSRSRPAAARTATKQQKEEIKRLLGKFEWGMSSEKVIGILVKEVRASYEEPLKKAIGDATVYDRIRREMEEKVLEIKNSLVKFEGIRTSWDVSLVEKEFAHKNNESMVVSWAKRDRRFFFFHHGKLWKIYIAFNAELFQDKTFDDFAKIMAARLGPPERIYRQNLKGEKVLDHLEWPPVGRSDVRAIDQTGFFGNFCLVLTDRQTLESVREGRRVNSPKKKYRDSLVDIVTKESEATGFDPNEDVVDQITGRTVEAPDVVDTYQADEADEAAEKSGKAAVRKRGPTKPKRTPKKKLDTNDPLKDMDF